MTVVFVHGNPETSAIWGPLVTELRRNDPGDIVLLSPPGFGAPLADDFGATHTEYRDWLAAELEKFDTPVDLVGHDWGGGHVVSVAMNRPELLHSWVSDVVGVFDEDYVWHDMAQVWQTPGAGEEAVDALMGMPPADRTALLAALGMPEDVTADVGAAFGPQMGRAILALYRSASRPAELGAELERAAERPGLSVMATADTFVGTEEQRRRAARRAGARVEVLDGLGHWWMLQDPKGAAEFLTRFWGSLD
ncbi:MAG TPA: alpha/beta hydrolase [Mycobacterium sp.]|nr:alpha/beta hydrolase [Mycobacterium sp.]